MGDINPEEAYRNVDDAFKEVGIEFQRDDKGHKYFIPNLEHTSGKVVSLANRVLDGTPFFATEIPYPESGKEPEFMAVLHQDDETYTFDPRNL